MEPPLRLGSLGYPHFPLKKTPVLFCGAPASSEPTTGHSNSTREGRLARSEAFEMSGTSLGTIQFAAAELEFNQWLIRRVRRTAGEQARICFRRRQPGVA